MRVYVHILETTHIHTNTRSGQSTVGAFVVGVNIANTCMRVYIVHILETTHIHVNTRSRQSTISAFVVGVNVYTYTYEHIYIRTHAVDKVLLAHLW
jgi:hypothetical protein